MVNIIEKVYSARVRQLERKHKLLLKQVDIEKKKSEIRRIRANYKNDRPYQTSAAKYFGNIKINEKPFKKIEKRTKKNFKRINKKNKADYYNSLM